jgi:5'-3' exonuclease
MAAGRSGFPVHVVDGTYELFRHYYAGLPPHEDERGREVGAVRGVLASVLGLLREGARHVGVATDHVIESFRNDLWQGYKTGEGMDPVLHAQFHPLEDALAALGVAVWPMVEHEADDALASAASIAARDPRVSRVFVCTPDKDLAQSVSGDRVVQLDRRRGVLVDEGAVRGRWGIGPESIPDWLALVGDSADGFPGLRGWGAKSASAVLGRHGHIESIPDDPARWGVAVRGADRLGAVLRDERDMAMLFRTLATLRTDAPVGDSVDAWRWRGPRPEFDRVARSLRAPELARRAAEIAATGV